MRFEQVYPSASSLSSPPSNQYLNGKVWEEVGKSDGCQVWFVDMSSYPVIVWRSLKNCCWRKCLDLIRVRGAWPILLAWMILLVISDVTRFDKRVRSGVYYVDSLQKSGPTKPLDLNRICCKWRCTPDVPQKRFHKCRWVCSRTYIIIIICMAGGVELLPYVLPSVDPSKLISSPASTWPTSLFKDTHTHYVLILLNTHNHLTFLYFCIPWYPYE